MKKSIFICNFLFLASAVCCGKEIIPLPMPENARLIDVRSVKEFRAGALPGALNIPHDVIDKKIAAAVPDKKTPLYLYCRSGRRVGVAMKTLKVRGYTKMYNLGGLKEASKKLKLPVKR